MEKNSDLASAAMNCPAYSPRARSWLSSTASAWGGLSCSNCEYFRKNVCRKKLLKSILSSLK